MNTSSQHEGIILTKNGEKLNPMNLINFFLIVTKLICSLIGIPLNVLIAIAIIRLRRLHSKPRHIFLLGIILADLYAFVPIIIQLTYWNIPIESVCEAYVAVVGLPYSILLLNMLLALVDRYVAIKKPMWHRKKVTVRRVGCCLLLGSASVTFVLKFLYIFGLAPLRCEIRHIHNKVLGWIRIVLFTSCIIINFIVYRQSRTLLQESRTLDPLKSAKKMRISYLKNRFIGENNDEIIDVDRNNDIIIEPTQPATEEIETQNAAAATVSVANDPSSSMTIHVNSETLSRIELEATRTLVAGVTSLFVMASPLIIYFLAENSCRFFSNNLECNRFIWVAPYLKELGLLHAVYNPLIWLLRNNEFRLVVNK